jgi:glyoxylase-like metal-dependent hydrolase (beta-lactamase superfamily II)
MRITEIKTGVFACLMNNESANAGFVITERGVIVVDTLDTPERGRQLAAEIRARTEKPVLFVINTHHHYDHVFGNQAFDAPVVANCALSGQLAQAVARDLSPLAIAAWVSEHPEDRWLADDLEVVYPNVIFEQRLVIDLPPTRLVLQHMGGHTPDTIVVDLPEQGVLFAGDLVFEGRVPFLRDAQIEKTLQALRQVQRLGARTIVPGHGALCDMTYVLRFRDYVEALREKVRELVDQDWKRADILDCDQLPRWWTDDRPDLQRANVARIYEELTGSPISA